MQRVVHQLDLTVHELYFPSLKDQSLSLSLHLSLRDSTFKAQVPFTQFPMDSPVIFEEEHFLPSDTVRIVIALETEEMGRADFMLRDLFQQTLEGNYEAWLKITETRQAPSLEKERSSEGVTLLKSLYSEGDQVATRQARMRVSVGIREIAKKAIAERDRERPPVRRVVALPEGLAQCTRCEYLERLTASQQNELQSLEESEKSYKQVSMLLEQYSEEQPSDYPETNELALDLSKTIKGQTGSLTAQEADHLRMVILGLNEKLKTLQVVHQEVMKLRGELHESHELRRQLESSVSETTEQLKRQSAKQDELHTHLIQERQAAVESLRLQHLKYREKCQDEDRLMGEIAKLKGTIQKLLAEAANYAQMKAHIEALKSELDESERQRQLLRQQYGKSAQEFEARVKENMLMQARLSAEKEALQGEVQRLQAALHAQRTENDRLSQDNATVKGKVSQLEADLTTYADQKRSLEETQQLSDQSHDNAVTVEVKMQEAAGEFSRRLEEVMQQNLRLQEEKGKVTAALNDVENTVELKNEQIQDLTREKMELTAAIATLEQLLVVQEDLRQIADTVSAQNAANTSLKDQLLKELGSLSQTLLQQSEKSLAANRLVVRLREMTEDKEAEVASLRRLVTELKQQRPIYVAVADDPVDQAIATFSNSQAKALPVPLLREDQGTYVFGSRRVFVKLEGGQVIVRVGGGFIPLEEFITTYTDLELDKLQARESELTTRHQSLLRKLASQAAVESLQSKTEASPSKAAKLMKDYFASSLYPSGRASLSPGRLSFSPQ